MEMDQQQSEITRERERQTPLTDRRSMGGTSAQ